MLTKVEVRTPTGMMLSLPLEETEEGFIIEDISGLDPVKATLSSSSFANLDGSQFHSSRREPRNILLTIGLEPDYVTKSVQDLRMTLYDYFMTKATVGLRFFLDSGLTVEISGIVESFNAQLFTKEPSVTISVMCFDPDFLGLTPIEVVGNTVSTVTEFLIDYPGTVETGIIFELAVDRVLEDFTIYHRPENDIIRSLDFSGDLVADDLVTINTRPGEKVVTLLRSSVLTSVLYGMTPQSNWIQLEPGENYLRVYAVGAAIPFTITYLPRYGGL